MYCVKFENTIKPYFAFFKPYNAVRDSETYSLTYLTPSIINGIEKAVGFDFGTIKRHKLKFNKSKMFREMISAVVHGASKKYDASQAIHVKQSLINPEIIFAVDNLEDAKTLYNTGIYGGQSEYLLYPSNSFGIQEMTEEEFNELTGVESFEVERGIMVGFNRFKDNKIMYIDIDRKEW